MLYPLLESLLAVLGVEPEYDPASPAIAVRAVLLHATLVPAIILCFAIAWNMLRTSRRYAVTTTAIAVTAYDVLSVWLELGPVPGDFVSVLSLVFAVFVVVWFWHVSTLDFFRALFTSLSCAVMMAVCVFAGQIADAVAVGEWRWLEIRVAWVDVAVTYALAAVFVAVLWRPARETMPRLLHSPVIAAPAWRVLWLAPFGLYALLMMYQDLYMDVLNDHAAQVGVVAAVMYAVLLVLLYWLLAKTDRESTRRIEAEERNRRLALGRVQLRSLTERMETARSTRHDLRQHVVALQAYAREGDMAAVRAYLDDVAGSAELDEPIAVCENIAVNAVVSYYLAAARKAGVTVDVRARVPGRVDVAVADIVVVLGNLLENAVAAAARCVAACGGSACAPDVTLRAHVDARGALLLTVDNRYVDRVRRDADGRLLSSRHAGAGVGLASVAAVVDRLGGEMRVDEGSPVRSDDDAQSPDSGEPGGVSARVFRVSVMMPASPEGESESSVIA